MSSRFTLLVSGSVLHFFTEALAEDIVNCDEA